MNMIELRPFSSASFDEAVPQGQPTVETPLQEIARNHYVITQTYMQHVDAYRKPQENQRMPREILPNLGMVAFHCYDGPRVPVNGSKIITFDRVWATVPPTFEEEPSFLLTVQNTSKVKLRKAGVYYTGQGASEFMTNFGIVSTGINASYPAKTQRDFFLIGSGGTYANTTLIPTRNEIITSYRDVSQLPLNVEYPIATYNSMVAALPLQDVPILSGVLSIPYWYDLTLSYPQNGTRYEKYATGYFDLSGTYISGQSKLVRYIGNIWERRSVNVVVS